MRTVTEIIIHRSATKDGQDFTVQDIDRWHRHRGFKMEGYHFVNRLDGIIEQCRPLEIIGAHCTGHIAQSIGICYIGSLDSSGKPKDTRTPTQKDVLWSLVKSLQKKYHGATLHGHNEFANKACPCFRVQEEL